MSGHAYMLTHSELSQNLAQAGGGLSQHGSINDGISKELSSLSYTSVDWVAEQVIWLGRGALLVKLDIQSAYRIVLVHPDDRCLLGVKWKGQVFVDCALSFGLRSACKIFTALADAVEWVTSQRGALGMAHYLDDYIMWGAPSSKDCTDSLRILLEVCSELGILVASQKCQGPSTCLVFIGIEFDTMSMELRLPEEKLGHLQALITSWRGRKSCQRKELESLVGHLHHACKVVHPGRRFLRGLLALLSRTHGRHHYVQLNESSRADIEWWHTFLAKWNGISVLRKASLSSPEVQLHSDASGSWGRGAVWGAVWFQVSWHWQVPRKFGLSSIAVKELLPIILAAGIWGPHWRGCTVCCCCDNEAVVSVVNSGACRDKQIAHLIRCLFFIEAHFDFSLVAKHVPVFICMFVPEVIFGFLQSISMRPIPSH